MSGDMSKKKKSLVILHVCDVDYNRITLYIKTNMQLSVYLIVLRLELKN